MNKLLRDLQLILTCVMDFEFMLIKLDKDPGKFGIWPYTETITF